MHPAAAYGIAGVATATTSFLGAQYTQQSVQSPWYDRVRPTFAPPNWVFPVVWTLLYIALTIAFGLSLQRDPALLTLLHALNLAANVWWCRTFFGQRQLGQGLVILVGNLGIAVAIAALTKTATVRYLLIPYIAWLSFATALNTGAYLNERTNP